MTVSASASASSDRYADGLSASRIWSPPDPALAAAGIEGEFVVARVRLFAMGLLLIAPTWSLLHDPHKPIFITGFLVTLTAALTSLAIWVALRRGRWRPWVGFASSALDVSLVSTALLTFLIVDSPLTALNSNVTFEMYFLALVATSLRYDARICIVVGGLALAEYAALWAWSAANYNLSDPALAVNSGPYKPVDLFTRLILLGIAVLLAVTIVRRAQRLLYLASRDRLTGLFNRGYFDRALVRAMERSNRDGQALSLAILDIDHFKQINDVHGHALGDRALCEVAARLERSMRRTDVVARYGGEEFVILMPSTSPDVALGLVEEIRRNVAATPIDLGDGRVLTIDFSAGVAGRPHDRDANNAKGLMQAADERLLHAKRAGRGRCMGAEAREPERTSLAFG
jgi:diguanylate cyclase (GGDEF)-like protein